MVDSLALAFVPVFVLVVVEENDSDTMDAAIEPRVLLPKVLAEDAPLLLLSLTVLVEVVADEYSRVIP